jgi:hypothetical protein
VSLLNLEAATVVAGVSLGNALLDMDDSGKPADMSDHTRDVLLTRVQCTLDQADPGAWVADLQPDPRLRTLGLVVRPCKRPVRFADLRAAWLAERARWGEGRLYLSHETWRRALVHYLGFNPYPFPVHVPPDFAD